MSLTYRSVLGSRSFPKVSRCQLSPPRRFGDESTSTESESANLPVLATVDRRFDCARSQGWGILVGVRDAHVVALRSPPGLEYFRQVHGAPDPRVAEAIAAGRCEADAGGVVADGHAPMWYHADRVRRCTRGAESLVDAAGAPGVAVGWSGRSERRIDGASGVMSDGTGDCRRIASQAVGGLTEMRPSAETWDGNELDFRL